MVFSHSLTIDKIRECNHFGMTKGEAWVGRPRVSVAEGSLRLVRCFQILPGLHFQQPGLSALELEAQPAAGVQLGDGCGGGDDDFYVAVVELVRSEEHTSELQSR